MAIEKIWKIKELEIRENFLGFDRYISLVAWTLTVKNNGETDGSVPVETIMHGLTPLNSPTNNFTPIENLTEQQVLDWVKTSLGPEKMNELECRGVEYCLNALAPIPKRIPVPW